MNKFILGIITGAILFVPVTVLAENSLPLMNDIYRSGTWVGGTVGVFDDGDYKCYTFTVETSGSISCVVKKMNKPTEVE
jgi:hypothetical protein